MEFEKMPTVPTADEILDREKLLEDRGKARAHKTRSRRNDAIANRQPAACTQ